MTENNKNKIEYSRIPPQAVDIERCVLGALLIDRDAFDKVSDRLRPESFYDARHQIIYGVIQSMKIENKPVDLFTIHEELERQKKLDKAGGIYMTPEILKQFQELVGEENAQIILI